MISLSAPAETPLGAGETRPAKLGACALLMLVVSLVAGVVVSTLGPSLTVPATDWAPLFEHPLPAPAMLAVTWGFTVVGGLGLILGLMATGRGWRFGPLPWIGLVGCAVLAVLPVAGSTDALSYAIYGRIAELGHDPYLYTPRELVASGDAVGQYAPVSWRDAPSVYGPIANWLFQGASAIGGTSIGATTQVLKVGAGLAFAATALLLHRMAAPGQRTRVHLLWTANPLLLWTLVGSGHVDVVTAFLLLAALAAGARSALASGVLVALAAAIKAPYGLAALGFAWTYRRFPATLAVLGGIAAGVVAAAYLLASPEALDVLIQKSGEVSWINPWGWLLRMTGGDHLKTGPSTLIGWTAALVFAGLLTWKIPERGDLAALKPVFVVCAAFLLTSPLLHPWYDAMIFPLLALLPRTRVVAWLEALIVVRLTIAAFGYLPGVPVTYKAKTDTMKWVDEVFIPTMVAGALFFMVIAVFFTLLLVRRDTSEPVRASSPIGSR